MKTRLVAFFLFTFSNTGFAQDSFKSLTDQEKLTTAGLTAVALYTSLTGRGAEEEANWTTPLPGDAEVTNWLGGNSQSTVSSAKNWSNVGLGTMTFTPLLFPGSSGGEGRWQVLQSFAVATIATQAVKKLTNRARPYTSQCRDNRLEQDCFSSYRNESFFSGHTSIAFTGAGLICAFRADAMCPLGIGVAAAVGALRIAGRQHYLSDVLVGGLVGWASGYHLAKWRVPEGARDGGSGTSVGYQISFPIP